MFFRNYLSSLILFVLLVLVPIDYFPSILIRIICILLLPALVWLLLGWIWNRWTQLEKLEDIFERILSGIISFAFLILAYLKSKSETHLRNTEYVRSYDGMEAVGEVVIVDGPDWMMVFIYIAIAALIIYFGVLKKGHRENNPKF